MILPHRPKVRDLIRILRWLGASPKRETGSSHQIWELPDGRNFTIVVKHMNDTVGKEVMGNFKRWLKENTK